MWNYSLGKFVLENKGKSKLFQSFMMLQECILNAQSLNQPFGIK